MSTAISDHASRSSTNRFGEVEKAKRHLRPTGLLVLMVLVLGWGPGLAADVRFETGGGQPLQTAVEQPMIAGELARLLFDFAFATDEIPEPGSFLDSLTFTLQTGDSSSTAILLTMDASGLAIAPSTPGGVMIDPGMVQVTPVAFFGSAGDPAMRSAYAVSFDVPSAFIGMGNNFYFDLFDNGNAVRSVGYIQNLAVVPEPSVLWLLLAGLFAVAGCKRFRF